MDVYLWLVDHNMSLSCYWLHLLAHSESKVRYVRPALTGRGMIVTGHQTRRFHDESVSVIIDEWLPSRLFDTTDWPKPVEGEGNTSGSYVGRHFLG